MLEKLAENVGACFEDNHFQVNKMVSKLITTGSLLHEKPDRKRTVLTEQKLDAIRASLETSPRNLLNDYISRDECFENVCMKRHKIFTTATVQDNNNSRFEEP
jgi:hypothetical protein